MNRIEEIRGRYLQREMNHDDAEGGWITINGAHIPVGENGELQGSTGSKIAASNQKQIEGKEAVSQVKEICKNKTVFGPAHDDKEFYNTLSQTLDKIKPGTCIETRTYGEGEKAYKKKDNGKFDVFKYKQKDDDSYGYVREKKDVSSSAAAAMLGWEQYIYDYDPNTKL